MLLMMIAFCNEGVVAQQLLELVLQAASQSFRPEYEVS